MCACVAAAAAAEGQTQPIREKKENTIIFRMGANNELCDIYLGLRPN